MPAIPFQSTVSVSSNCSSLPGIARALEPLSEITTDFHLCSLLLILTCDFDLCWSCLLGAGEVPCAASVPASICLLDPRDHQVPLPHDLELVGRGEVQELPILDPPEHVGDENLKNRDLLLSPDHRFGVTLWRRTAQNDIVPDSCRCLDGAHQELALDVCKGNIQ